MFAPIQLDLPEIICGTTYDPDAIVLLVDEELVDLSGCTVIIVIHNGENIAKTLTTDDGLTVSAGTIAINIDYENTKLLPGGEYLWYLNVTETSGAVYRYAEGRISIRQEPEGPLLQEKAAVDVAYAVQNSLAKTTIEDADELAIVETSGLRKASFASLVESTFPALDARYSTADGTQWHFGASVPSDSLGVNGDFYFRSNNEIYRKVGGSWEYVSTVKGDTGDAGANGATGSTGATGPQGPSGIADIRSGVVTVGMNTYNSGDGFYYSQYSTTNVSFSPAFSAVPKVTATAYIADGGGSGGTVGVWVSSISTTGMMIVASSKYNTEADIYWTAVVASTGSGGVSIGASYSNINDFGSVDSTGATDITSIMQTAHSTGRIIFYPKGIYKFSSLSLPYGGGVIGEGKGLTRLYTPSITGDVISYTEALSSEKYGGLTFKSFELTCNDRSSGAHIKIAPTGGYEIWDVGIFDVALWHVYNGFVIDNAAHWKMTDCSVFNWWGSAVTVANSAWGDSGDSVIKGCTFGNGRTAGQSILQTSSGGLKVQANKMNGGNYGYVMDITAGVATSILPFVGNSIENQGVAAMAFNVGSGGYFGFVTVSDNEMALNPKGISINAIGSRLQSIIIANNHISATNIAVEMAGGDKVLMQGNIINGNNYAMSIGSGCTNGRALGNITSGSISNSSASFTIS